MQTVKERGKDSKMRYGYRGAIKEGEERREAYRTKTERLTDKPDTASLHSPVQHMEDRDQ